MPAAALAGFTLGWGVNALRLQQGDWGALIWLASLAGGLIGAYGVREALRLPAELDGEDPGRYHVVGTQPPADTPVSLILDAACAADARAQAERQGVRVKDVARVYASQAPPQR